MSVSIQHLETAAAPEIATALRNAGLAGAGGAGFPTYAKWERLDETPYLLMNHQESEPNYAIDKWLGREYADEFASLFDALLGTAFEVIVVGAKEKDRDKWHRDLEEATDATVRRPEDLPLDPAEESGVVFAYTTDTYQYGMESVLLRTVADTLIRGDLPMDHGWIVQNTETLFNLKRTLEDDEPVTRKFVHVDGDVPEHRFLDVPVGTTASDLLAAAGKPSGLADDEILADGGPGWCFEITESPDEFGVTKRTNCLLVLDREEAEENTFGNDRINLIDERDWSGDHEVTPTRFDPDRVRVPLRTNPSFGIVEPSRPVVEDGESVQRGEMIAVPASDAISNAQHASVDGTVTAVTDTHIELRRESTGGSGSRAAVGQQRMVYWTWCRECGDYIARPDFDHLGDGIDYVCRDCR